MASGAMFQSPACRSLAIRRAPRLGASWPEVLDLADGELVGGQLAAGGVVDDVLADLDGLDHRGVGRAVLGLVPVAGEVLGRVDDHGPAAVLDAPERVDVGVEHVLGPPDRVVLGAGGGACTPRSGKISFISARKPWSNSVRPQQASAKMKPPCST